MGTHQLPASWFFESATKDSDGVPSMEGPYSANEIHDLVQRGVLRVESRVYNVENNTWVIAADVVPHVSPGHQTPKIVTPFVEPVKTQAPAPQPIEHKKVSPTYTFHAEPEIRVQPAQTAAPRPAGAWAPPPRPAEIKNRHVVDHIEDEDSEHIDYFALIRQAKRPEVNRLALASSKNKASQAARVSQIRDVPDLEEELAGATESLKKFGAFFGQNQKKFMASAALALVVSGGWQLIGSFNKDRVPAASKVEKKEVEARKEPEAIKMQSGGSVGGGMARVSRANGGVSAALPTSQMPQTAIIRNNVQAAPMAPQMDQTGQQQDQQQGGNSQFYSTADDSNPGQMAEAMPPGPPPQPMTPPMGMPDPNTGAVQPPGFMPPNGDPNSPNGPGGATPSTF